MTIASQAMMLARRVHRDQRYQYTGASFIDHLAQVAGVAATLGNSANGLDTGSVVAAYWLRHCVDHPAVTDEDLGLHFDKHFIKGLRTLSDPKPGNPAERLRRLRARLGLAPQWIQHVLCAEIVVNASSIGEHDQALAKDYKREAQDLLQGFKDAERPLWELARESTEVA